MHSGSSVGVGVYAVIEITDSLVRISYSVPLQENINLGCGEQNYVAPDLQDDIIVASTFEAK
jgi:hypothetical protein